MTFKELSRQNTGRQMCDSGDYYGRNYDKPLPEKPISITCNRDKDDDISEFYASISLGELLDATLDIDEKIQEQFAQIYELEENQHVSWKDLMDTWAEKYEYTEQGNGYNTYNNENDLDQDFQYHIYSPYDEDGEDWFYSENTVIFIQTHNGCDIRGGYSNPLPCKQKSTEGPDWLDNSVEWRFEEGVDADGEEIEHTDLQILDDHYQIGYSNTPTYEFMKNIEKILEVNEDEVYVRVLLDTGETVKACPYTQTEMGG